MLVLTRRVGETIMVGDDVKITVQRLSGNRVAIGIDAPHDRRILRGELEPFATAFDDTSEGDGSSAASADETDEAARYTPHPGAIGASPSQRISRQPELRYVG